MNQLHRIELLLVDDDVEFRQMMSRWFRDAGFEVMEAGGGEEAFALAAGKEFDVAVVDLMMPGIDGVSVLKEFKSSGADVEVILLTGKASVSSAVDAMKSGAFDYLMKPVPLRELEAVVRRAFEHTQLSRENRRLRALLQSSTPRNDMVGNSPAMREVFRLIDRAGPSDTAVLIEGESGTGKELAARALHSASSRRDKPFVVLNCAAISEAMMESELFGHERNAFPGAEVSKTGLLEVANGGSLFIDEIAELPHSAQSKLMRVLEDGVIRRVGASREQRVDVRLIAATRRRLIDDVRARRFREDLYYRINVMSMEVPPVRKRDGDIPLLVAHLLGAGWSIEPKALEVLQQYSWPGNVRQLGNTMERAKILADNKVVRVDDLPEEVRESPSNTTQKTPAGSDNLASIERAKVVEVLRRMSGNKTHAARKLGIDRRKLYRLVEKYRIDAEEFSEATK